METNALKPTTVRAIAVLRGETTGDDAGIQVMAAKNDYNSRGRGSTTSRRVLRNAGWQWVGPNTSSGRLRADDRHDETQGYVFEGEILAQFTLGKACVPDKFYLVRVPDAETTPLRTLEHTKTKTGYRLTLPDGSKYDVSDPAWR